MFILEQSRGSRNHPLTSSSGITSLLYYDGLWEQKVEIYVMSMALYFLWSFLITRFLFMQAARYLWKGNRFIKAWNWAGFCLVFCSRRIYYALISHRYWLVWCRPPGWHPALWWCSPGSEVDSEVACCVSVSASEELPPGRRVWRT